MVTKFGVLAFSVAFVTPVAALAQDFSGAVTLGYSHTDVPDADIKLNGLSLDGRLDFSMGNGLTFGARYNTFNLDVAGIDADVSGNLMAFDVTYDVSSAFSAGVFIEHAELGVDIGGISLGSVASSNTFGIEGHYKTGAMDFGAFVATGEPGGLIAAGLAGVDLTHFGLSATYTPSDALTVGGSFIRTNLDGGPLPTDVDIDYIGLAAVYDINDKFSVFGGLSRTKTDIVDLKATTISLGGSYDMSSFAGMPLMASLELAQTKPELFGTDTDINSIRLGLTIPLGGNAAKAPLNSGADAILNPSHSALSQTLLSF